MSYYQFLKFYGKDGSNLNFTYDPVADTWSGNVYFDKTSVGLFDNQHIFILEEVYGAHASPLALGMTFPVLANVGSPIPQFWQTSWTDDAAENEIFAYVINEVNGQPIIQNYEVINYSNTEVSYTVASDGHKIVPTFNQTPLKVNIAFTSQHERIYDRTLQILDLSFPTPRLVATVNFHGESVGEDDRLELMLENFGRSFDEDDALIVASSDIAEPLPDWQLINQKRKELLLEGENIYPYIGAYKAFINVIKFFEFQDMRVKEYWLNIDVGLPGSNVPSGNIVPGGHYLVYDPNSTGFTVDYNGAVYSSNQTFVGTTQSGAVPTLSTLYYTMLSGTFTASTQAYLLINSSANSFKVGDVITGSISGATTTVTGISGPELFYDPSVTVGSFVPNDSITGSVSGAAGTVFDVVLLENSVGFAVGETVTGGTSGATAVVLTNNNFLTLSTVVGAFVAGETVTGKTSGTTASVTSFTQTVSAQTTQYIILSGNGIVIDSSKLSHNYGKLQMFQIDGMFTGTINPLINHPLIPSTTWKKTNMFGLFYDLNKETGEVDQFGTPIVADDSQFTPEEVLIKIFALKNLLMQKFLPLNARIVDITGEGIYFAPYGIRTWTDINTVFTSDVGVQVGFDVLQPSLAPSGIGFVDDLREFLMQRFGPRQVQTSSLDFTAVTVVFGDTYTLTFTVNSDDAPFSVSVTANTSPVTAATLVSQFAQAINGTTNFPVTAQAFGDVLVVTESSIFTDGYVIAYPAGAVLGVPQYLTLGDLTGTFQVGESVSQATTGANGTVCTVYASVPPVICLFDVAGTFNTVNTVTGATSFASAIPASAGPASNVQSGMNFPYRHFTNLVNPYTFGQVYPAYSVPSLVEAINDYYTQVNTFPYPYDADKENYMGDEPGIVAGCPVILQANADQFTWNDMTMSWDSTQFGPPTGSPPQYHGYTWDNIDFSNFYDIEWDINLPVSLTVPSGYSFTMRGPVGTYYILPHFLPYAGTYSITMRLYDLFNYPSVVIQSNAITVNSKQLEVSAFCRFRNTDDYTWDGGAALETWDELGGSSWYFPIEGISQMSSGINEGLTNFSRYRNQWDTQIYNPNTRAYENLLYSTSPYAPRFGTVNLTWDNMDVVWDELYHSTWDMYDYHAGFLGGFRVFDPSIGDGIQIDDWPVFYFSADSPEVGLSLEEAAAQLNASLNPGIAKFTWTVRFYAGGSPAFHFIHACAKFDGPDGWRFVNYYQSSPGSIYGDPYSFRMPTWLDYSFDTPSIPFLLVGSVTGVFQVGDHLTGSVSGATTVVTAISGQSLQFATSVGVFQIGDQVTGSISGAHGTVYDLSYGLSLIQQIEDTTNPPTTIDPDLLFLDVTVADLVTEHHSPDINNASNYEFWEALGFVKTIPPTSPGDPDSPYGEHLGELPAWRGRGAFTTNDLRFFDQQFQVPLGVPVFIVVNHSEVPGKTNFRWVVTNEITGAVVVDIIDKPFAIVNFDEESLYNVEVWCTDSNGNPAYVMKKGFIQASSRANMGQPLFPPNVNTEQIKDQPQLSALIPPTMLVTT